MNVSDNRSVTAAFEEKKPGKGNRKKDQEFLRMSAQRMKEQKQQAELDSINNSQNAFNFLAMRSIKKKDEGSSAVGDSALPS